MEDLYITTKININTKVNIPKNQTQHPKKIFIAFP